MPDILSIAAIVIAVAVFITLIALWRRGIIDEQTIEATGELMESVGGGDSAFGAILKYAATAVWAVEQLVKTGRIPKENQKRKDAAMRIVQTAAAADGLGFGALEQEVADACIEAEVQRLPRNQQKPPDGEAA